jgi:hypothetical protein
MKRALAAAVLAAATFSAVPVFAQEGSPQPGCLGVAVSDPAGDQERITGQEGPASADILGVFFTFSEGKQYANLQLADAKDELAVGATGARWYVYFKVGNLVNWVRATKTGPVASTFNYGHIDEAGSRVSDGTAEGKFFAGPNGVIQVQIPAEAGGKTGTATGAPYAETHEAVGNQLLLIDETKPGKAFTMGTCPQAAPTPGPAEPGAPAAPAAPAAPRNDVVALQVSVPKSGKAKGRSLVLKLRSRDEIRDIRATLKKGSATVGSGSLASLKGKGNLKLKLTRKPKRGSYTLELTGTNADGRTASLKTSLKLK